MSYEIIKNIKKLKNKATNIIQKIKRLAKTKERKLDKDNKKGNQRTKVNNKNQRMKFEMKQNQSIIEKKSFQNKIENISWIKIYTIKLKTHNFNEHAPLFVSLIPYNS